jgi:hypothetical protein
MTTDKTIEQAYRAEAARWGRIATTAAERGDSNGVRYAVKQALKYTRLVLELQPKENVSDGADGTGAGNSGATPA